MDAIRRTTWGGWWPRAQVNSPVICPIPLHQQLVDRFNSLEQRLSVCLQEANVSGTLPEDLSVAEGVGYLMTNIYGLRVASRTGLGKAEARQRMQLLIRMISTN